MTEKVASAKKAVSKMLMYYHQALLEAGSLDPKQEMATELAKAVRLSSEQTEFVVNESNCASKKKALNNIKILLESGKAGNALKKADYEVMIYTLKEVINWLG